MLRVFQMHKCTPQLCLKHSRDVFTRRIPFISAAKIHTVVGPMFEQHIGVEIGEVVQRNGFAYADIVNQSRHRFLTIVEEMMRREYDGTCLVAVESLNLEKKDK